MNKFWINNQKNMNIKYFKMNNNNNHNNNNNKMKQYNQNSLKKKLQKYRMLNSSNVFKIFIQ